MEVYGDILRRKKTEPICRVKTAGGRRAYQIPRTKTRTAICKSRDHLHRERCAQRTKRGGISSGVVHGFHEKTAKGVGTLPRNHARGGNLRRYGGCERERGEGSGREHQTSARDRKSTRLNS